MVWSAPQGVFPVSSLPKSESLHFVPIITHRRVAIHVILQVEVHQLLHIRSDDLIWAESALYLLTSCTERRTSIDKDDFVQIHWEQDIQEQDLVCPNYPLFLGLSSKPMRPFICHHFVFEPVFLGQVRDECLGGSAHVTSRG